MCLRGTKLTWANGRASGALARLVSLCPGWPGLVGVDAEGRGGTECSVLGNTAMHCWSGTRGCSGGARDYRVLLQAWSGSCWLLGFCPHPGAPGGGVCKVKGAPCALVDPLGEGTRQAAQGAGQWAHEGQGV